ncbi:MAG: sigma-70 family RNA polymerase sigma factor [Betaproteobacteria bacterium]
MVASPAVSFEQQLVAHRGYLLKFARLQLRNESWAEDAVSETLLAALNKPQGFANRSQLKTWLVGILKHKVMDVFRHNARTVAVDIHAEGSASEDVLDGLVFRANGHFMHPPADWGNPEQDLQSRQFMTVLEACTEKMPPAMGRAFLMREWLELSSEEICNEMGLSSTNLYVTLHRARLRLRECLELNWFGGRSGSR